MTDKGEIKAVKKSSLSEKVSSDISVPLENTDSELWKSKLYNEREHDLPGGAEYEYFSENIYFRYIKLEKDQVKISVLHIPKDSVQMIFCLQGKCKYLDCLASKDFEISRQHHNMIYTGKEKVKEVVHSEGAFELVLIYIKLSYLLNYKLPHLPDLDIFLTKVCNNKSCMLKETNLVINYKIGLVLYQLLVEKVPSSIKFHFMEAKVVELMMLQWSILIKDEEQKKDIPLKEEEVHKMNSVKEILIKNMANHLTLKDLAHEVGTNEYNLKKHFKIVHGQTVFGFLHTYKMELAKAILMDPTIKISDLSERLGYKHATHFTAAYKKHFGYLPKTAK